ncbi:Abi family protein [Entomospira culicis]|uniref:Abi family protein n=1 Tax=Entomospira culicis TaxID=2719989 RepID=A0A968GGS5_9SPIO|nr:Abi family protein [Entomospira culicis]NIZ19989.1 Abi family protein [Entomospira culicis]NIZ70209.1 Abi family protein [Entomospira culicis]WDI38078.1 Abi family protein [Entomospira culicis]WDI39701.1 Abi family protein [Entomospira culicis]
MDKPKLMLKEQVDLLKHRGLTIETADEILLQEINYYLLINGYKDPFVEEQSEQYHQPTALKELYALYQFDSYLRSSTLHLLLSLEIYFKTMISDELAIYLLKKYPKEKSFEHNFYLDSALYQPIKNSSLTTESILNQLNKIIDHNEFQTPQIDHYVKKHGYVPLWVLMGEMSLGLVSKFYLILPLAVQQAIYKRCYPNIGLHPQKIKKLADSMHQFSLLRNHCAHGRRIYAEQFRRSNLIDILNKIFNLIENSITLKQEIAVYKKICTLGIEQLHENVSIMSWQRINNHANQLLVQLEHLVKTN